MVQWKCSTITLLLRSLHSFLVPFIYLHIKKKPKTNPAQLEKNSGGMSSVEIHLEPIALGEL